MPRTLTSRAALAAAVTIVVVLAGLGPGGAAGRYANPQLLIETEEVARLTDALFEAGGLRPDRTAIVYCHTGVRAAQDYLALRLLGHTRIRNYDGSWMEWARTPALPVER